MFVRKKITTILLRFGCKRNVVHNCARIQGEYFSSEQRSHPYSKFQRCDAEVSVIHLLG